MALPMKPTTCPLHAQSEIALNRAKRTGCPRVLLFIVTLGTKSAMSAHPALGDVPEPTVYDFEHPIQSNRNVVPVAIFTCSVTPRAPPLPKRFTGLGVKCEGGGKGRQG